jgi:hypothetical protein
MQASHSGNSFQLRPNDEGIWQSTREFGYDATTNRWFVETDLAVSGNVAVTGDVTASDVTAAGTSMSAIKSFMDNNAGSGGVESLFEGFDKLVNLSKNLEVGGVYYIQTAGMSGTDTCRSSLLEDNQFTVFTFTGIGQSTTIWGLCGVYTTAETMTVTASNQLTITTGYSYDVVVRKVIRIN